MADSAIYGPTARDISVALAWAAVTVKVTRSRQQRPSTFEPAFLRDTGLDAGFLDELTLKALYYSAHPTAGDMAETLTVSVPVIQEVLAQLTRDGLCEIVASEGQGPATHSYSW